MTLDRLESRVFRASPSYELVLYDRLPEAERQALAELRVDPELYGVLKPRPGTPGTIKTVGRDTALLYLTLREPGRLPAYVGLSGSAGWRREIAQLVLEGILEIEVDARFLSGPDAASRLAAPSIGGEAPSGRVNQLSHQALRYASALCTEDPIVLAMALYAYHRVPVSPRRARALRGASALCRFLQIAPGGEPSWTRASGSDEGWLVWRRSATARGVAPTGFGYKLYVSPTVDALPHTTRPVFAALANARCEQLKIGTGAPGLYRPDKLVAYFATFEDLALGADRVKREIGGAPPQGVPFTADIDSTGLLSWGMDPPADPQLRSWRGPESWRAWLTNRLGLALSQCKRPADAATPPWAFALERLRLVGIDVERWTPNPSIWNAFVASGA